MMSVYYTVYAEVKVGNKWYNLTPIMKDRNGVYRAQPLICGQSYIREAYEELQKSSYASGRPHDISEELRQVFPHDDEENVKDYYRDMTYKQYYSQVLCVVNYGKSVKSRVKADRQTRYRGYVNKYNLAAYEIGETEDIVNWIHSTRYEELSEESKKEYAYYEWNEWGDWYAVYVDLVHKVDALLSIFNEWSWGNLPGDLDETGPSADYVRLIVERD